MFLSIVFVDALIWILILNLCTGGKKKCRLRIHNTSTADEMCQIHVCKIIITKILDNCYHVGILIRNRALVLYSFFDPDKYVYSSTPTSTCILWPDKRVYLWYCSFIVEPIFIVYQLIVSIVQVNLCNCVWKQPNNCNENRYVPLNNVA